MKKICFFSGDITRSGGTERVGTVIANELHKKGQVWNKELLAYGKIRRNILSFRTGHKKRYIILRPC